MCRSSQTGVSLVRLDAEKVNNALVECANVKLFGRVVSRVGDEPGL